MSEPTLSKCFICTKESEDGRFLYPEESDFVFYQLLGVSDLKQSRLAQWMKFKNVCYCSTCLENILQIRLMVGDLIKLEEKISTERTNILKQLIENSDSLKNASEGKPKGMLQVLREEIVEEVDMFAKIKWTLPSDVYFSYDSSSEEPEVNTRENTTDKSTKLSRRKSAESQTEDVSKKCDLGKKPHRLSDKNEPKDINSSRVCLPRKCKNVPDIVTMVTDDDAKGIKSKTDSREELSDLVDGNVDDFEIFARTIISEVHNMSSSSDGEMEIFRSEDTLRVNLTKNVPIGSTNEKLDADVLEQSCIENVGYVCDICDQMLNDNNSFDTHKLTHTIRIPAGENKTVQEHGQDVHVDKKDTLVLTDDEDEMILSQDPEILKQTANIPPQRPFDWKEVPNILKAKKGLKQDEHQSSHVPRTRSQRQALLVLKRLPEAFKLGPKISKQQPKSLKQNQESLKQSPNISHTAMKKKQKARSVGNVKPMLWSRVTPYHEPKRCEECGQVLSNQRNLKLHRLVVHRRESKYTCELCDFTGPSPNRLKIHMNTCHLVKRFKCDLCEQSFKRNQTLQRHKKGHDGYTPYKCKLCPGRFKNSKCLVVHTNFGDCQNKSSK